MAIEHPTSELPDQARRNDLARQASYQLEVLALMLQREAIGEAEGLDMLVLAVSPRLLDLARVVMSSVSETTADLPEMTRMLGSYKEAQHG